MCPVRRHHDDGIGQQQMNFSCQRNLSPTVQQIVHSIKTVTGGNGCGGLQPQQRFTIHANVCSTCVLTRRA